MFFFHLDIHQHPDHVDQSKQFLVTCLPCMAPGFVKAKPAQGALDLGFRTKLPSVAMNLWDFDGFCP